MFQRLIDHSPDLKRLRDEGYVLEERGGYICISHVPYLTSLQEVKYGIMFSSYTTTGERIAPPPDHTVYFMGEAPCHKGGIVMDEIINSYPNQPMGYELTGNIYFSSKPAEGNYVDFYAKFTRYIALLGAPARSIHPGATALTFAPIKDDVESIFEYVDSNASRAGIVSLSECFKRQKIAIVGLGGTGAYMLDFVAKTPVAQIHLFDGDVFSQHNAFRCPGAPSLDELRQAPLKVDYLQRIYSRMHKGIVSHPFFIDADNLNQLDGFTYVFISVDRNATRKQIINHLVRRGIPFTDVGLGVNAVDGNPLGGIVRTTTGVPGAYDHVLERVGDNETAGNDYVTNIQIAELNALNAFKAVEKWKKYIGFYRDDIRDLHNSYTIDASLLINGNTQS